MKKNQILYGGSVNLKNAVNYLKEAGFDGLLVGGASLNPKEFRKIIKNVDFFLKTDKVSRHGLQPTHHPSR